eukprot:CAMPEP_0176433520 /NCGR_PEP_ID=MMETSP0127-20121128/16076_1 /TAXON_ID=938130 /ORGANISM="Platyophrya macrostoma, Strain WH" /LENGTH=272 /DNA_ID=CAMNT_0017815973 /DNA_START=326 /DNA_END=1144 /DNA_ORIENTATION=-
MLANPNFLYQQSLESLLLSDLIDLERRALQSLEILLESGLLEEQKEQGLNRDQIDNIEVSEYQAAPVEKVPVGRLKTRNGIHKKPKGDPKKAIKEGIKEAIALQREKSEPTSNSTCAICFEDYVNKDKLRKLPCSHKFHKDCIDKWLTMKNNCPVCKGKPVEEPQSNPPANRTTPALFNNNDILQLLSSHQRQVVPPVTNNNSSTSTTSMNAVQRLPGLINNMQNISNIRNSPPIVINDDSNEDVRNSQSSNRQTRRTTKRRGESTSRKTVQ